MKNYIELLQKNGLLKIIDKPCCIDLEIAHISYLEIKKEFPKTLLFTNPIDKNGQKFHMPVLTNLFSSNAALQLFFDATPDEIANKIKKYVKPKKPENFSDKVNFFKEILELKNIFPKKTKTKAQAQEIILDKVDLYKLPILKTWEDDAGYFITMGQVYTKSLDGKSQNLGMYRLQIHNEKELGMHWQIHKDGAHFFYEYKKANKKMPVSVAIGGDPLYIWCGQAPMPKNIFELMLYGLVRKSPAKLVKSLSNDIYIPYDVDIVIEGFVDTNEFKIEGPFGDHTGFYTPAENFPVMKVEKITHKKDAIFYATVVGKPPLEDKYMGFATERIFLPLLQTSIPDLIDYRMPENGVFHNLILAKFDYKYPAHASQLAHAFWGIGQMSFVKHAIFLPLQAPNLNEYNKICEFVLNRLTPQSLLISSGICDQLDHSSPNSCFGGKLAIDASLDYAPVSASIISDKELLTKFQTISEEILDLKQIFTHTKNPIVLIKIKKQHKIKEIFEKLLNFRQNFKILIFLDNDARLNNHYMNVWRITNNIDAIRDIFIDNMQICIDATSKGKLENHNRKWPKMTNCTKEVIENLINKSLIQNDENFFEKYEIFG